MPTKPKGDSPCKVSIKLPSILECIFVLRGLADEWKSLWTKKAAIL